MMAFWLTKQAHFATEYGAAVLGWFWSKSHLSMFHANRLEDHPRTDGYVVIGSPPIYTPWSSAIWKGSHNLDSGETLRDIPLQANLTLPETNIAPKNGGFQ